MSRRTVLVLEFAAFFAIAIVLTVVPNLGKAAVDGLGGLAVLIAAVIAVTIMGRRL